ncbi:hypothetical protein J2W56_006702 [Nocardia kruczakiae]|uniref:Mutator family transposase n=1 Tax=Nocardia kruczakiae TaxID=261477 RepID=A0ABU1XQY6_9NOCA|nr:hypothetical protein [Nocardia kruczakiae]
MILQKTAKSLEGKKVHAMTSVQPIDPSKMLSDQLAVASPDLLREMMSTFIQALMRNEADSMCGAGYGERFDERVNSRNGYRHRDFDTHVGTIDVAIPKLRHGSYFPDWLLERPNAPNEPSPRWSPPATCSGCPPDAWRNWSNH